MMSNLIITVVILISITMPTFSYSCNNYPKNGTFLQFTDPEPIYMLVRDVGKHVSLLCCAANYDTITWYFQDQPYPNWSNISIDRISNYIRLGQNKQELEIDEVNDKMEGRYKCVISKDDGESLEFTQTLQVKPIQAGDIYLIQEKNCVDKSARVGENVTFYCKFYVGPSEFCPIIKWEKNDAGKSYHFGYEKMLGFYSNYTIFVVKTDNCTEGEAPTLGTALHIYKVSDDAFGLFQVTLIREKAVSLTLNLTRNIELEPEKSPLVVMPAQSRTHIAIVLGATLVSLFVLTLMYVFFKTDLHLFYKKNIERRSADDKKKYDAFISHSNSDEDSKFVISNLRQFLVDNLSYNVCVDDINFLGGEDHSTASVNAVNSSRCCILVLSPDYVKNQHCSIEFSNALEKHKLKKNIIPIMFRTLSPDSLKRQEALQHLIKAGNVIKWKPNGTNKTFWKKLEVRMPSLPN